MKEFDMFSYRIDITDIKTLDILKNRLLDGKAIHSKFRYVIKPMTLEELKNFMYTGYHETMDFEGVAPIVTSICEKDFYKLTMLIKNSTLKSISILRLLLFALNNENLYEDGTLGYYIKIFKSRYIKKFNNNLLELSSESYIDDLDILNLFYELIKD